MQPTHGAAAADVDAALLRFLTSPVAHAALAGTEPPACVETVQTHMSWVFLAGDHVLKLKKPVRHELLDFSTLAARRACCREEVRLNARLAPGVYRGLVAVTRRGERLRLVPESALDERTPVVEWLVWMRRLPRERLLDRVIAGAGVQPPEVDSVVNLLVGFYRRAARVEVAPDAYLARLQDELDRSSRLLLQPAWRIGGAAPALHRMAAALRRHRATLGRRAAEHRIVEGHGDLRPEHVCLLQPPVVIDCIEFSAALRQVDPFDELAFLALECSRAGDRRIGPRLIAGCAAGLGDRPPPAVLPLYTAARALVRARLSLAHLLDAAPRTPARWLPQTVAYVALAQAALDALDEVDAAPAPASGAC